MAWPASRAEVDMMATEVPIHLHALWAGLIPPFSNFFNVVLSHYQINTLHLDPQSIILLVVFAFVYEAMVGIAPSITLLHHFFSLHLTDALHRSGCVSLQAIAATAGSESTSSFRRSSEAFRKRWVYVDVGVRNPLLLLPRIPAAPSSGWEHARLADQRLAHVWLWLARLKGLGVTAPMVVKKFIRCGIAPLHRHSRPMWTFSGYGDRMRLQVPALPPEARRTMLELLTGDPMPANLLEEGCLLYCCSNKVEFARQMPPFDEWGLRPAGLEGPHESPFFMAPLVAICTVLVP